MAEIRQTWAGTAGNETRARVEGSMNKNQKSGLGLGHFGRSVIGGLTRFDGHTRECLGGIVDYSITGLDLAEQLDVLAIDRVMPQALRMDNGPELVGKALAEWASETDRVFIPPGQPWRDGYVESFNGKLRDECLNIN